ncbi:SAF domain-containing protein [Corynebacterium lipophiloflavum]|uniref:SAF domain protein n=1 Tax=Corynebacterium lipophiloflavum (strain ATCC 700352 / DSM 44291 / CCUG 37336 / JCM 10383 / DMMZ 1944) TaxID=525263 RepID=C0XQ59_CORLD|nr:SAF domain-containing protein [Corynebacterium lipophiloflavum]EEI17547.1 SAF domain protein [Corynebacterium lipophiloflavum DSM 44291]
MKDASSLFQTLREPGYRRSVALRRALAAALLVAALMSAAVSRGADPMVLAFAQPASAGDVLEPSHLQLRRFPADAVPDNALTDIDAATGQILAAAASRGEVVTSTRLVGPDLASELVGEQAPEAFSLVPVALAEPDIIPMLHHGATVSVVTMSPDGAQPRTIATGAKVVVAGAEEGTVMLLLPNTQAAAVAAASLATPLTVVLGGT